MNGHVGKEVDGFPEVHGGFGFGKRNMEGVRVLELCEAMELIVCNTYFNKEKSKLVTYVSGAHETMTDFILERRRHRMVKDVKVVPNEDCAPQHKLVVARVEIRSLNSQAKYTFEPRIKTWKLNNVDIQRRFQDLVSDTAKNRQSDDDIDSLWNKFKHSLLDSAEAVCCRTKGPSRHRETWWWNEEVENVIATKRQCFNRWKKVN